MHRLVEPQQHALALVYRGIPRTHRTTAALAHRATPLTGTGGANRGCRTGHPTASPLTLLILSVYHNDIILTTGGQQDSGARAAEPAPAGANGRRPWN